MIAIQVAVGIVLAYIIIVNQRVLLRFGKATATFILWAAIFGLVAYFATVAYQAVSPTISPTIGKFVSKLGTIATVIVFFIVGGISGAGLQSLWYKIHNGRESQEIDEEGQDRILFAWSLINAIFVIVVFYGLSLTPLFELYNATDDWSRSNGHDDLGAMMLFVAALPWPFIPLWFVRRKARAILITPVQSEKN